MVILSLSGQQQRGKTNDFSVKAVITASALLKKTTHLGKCNGTPAGVMIHIQVLPTQEFFLFGCITHEVTCVWKNAVTHNVWLT